MSDDNEAAPVDGSMEGLRGDASPLEIAKEVVLVLEGRRGRAALATVVGRSGSAPQVVGAKLLLHEDGRSLGTVGGGAIEQEVLSACQRALREGRSQTVQAHLVRDLAMCCGGSMEVFVEFLQPTLRLTIVGAGHVAQAIAPMARAVGFRLRIVDDREALLGDPAFEGCERLHFDVDELAAALPDLGERDAVLVMTRDHARDEQALTHLLGRPHGYLGMIGSVRKVHAVLRRILQRSDGLGRPRPDLSRLRAPVGLALGGRTPAEIAVSVVAELVALRNGGSGASMNVVGVHAEGSRGPSPVPGDSAEPVG